ncbi:hypothetical protein [Peromfec virus RodF7_4]|uniref:Uncharacterized protein n=1 Tax=Peromfec virus RodF7_4 TaxID=2929353 RepID=A0A976N322_9VIRU|nr:hypothetical protein [Peromfec virus RodF7_4]
MCYICIVDNLINLIMESISITRFDLRSTPENPIKPVTIVTSASCINKIIAEHLDSNHTLLIQSVSTSFDSACESPSDDTVSND